MYLRVVAIVFALSVSVAATAQQIVQRAAQPAASLQKSPPPATDRRLLPPGRDVWDHPDEPGAWIAWRRVCDVVPGTDRQLAAEWEKQLKALAALVRACPVFRDIRGYYPQLMGCVNNPGGTGTGPWGGTLHLALWPPVAVERTPAGEAVVRNVWLFEFPNDWYLRINYIGDLGFSWFWGEDTEGRFYELPETRPGVAGLPVIGDFLSISLPTKPPRFTPITQERAQRWIIDNLKRQASADTSILESARRTYEEFVGLAGKARRAKAIEDAAATLKRPEDQEAERRRLQTIDRRREQDLRAAATPKAGSPEARTIERIAQLEARLAAMSPEQRGRPAWYKRHPEGVRRLDYGDIVEEGTAGARPLVVPNPAYFDPALPKTAMQLVITQPDHYEPATRDPRQPHWRVFQAVIEQMDWRGVAAMLK